MTVVAFDTSVLVAAVIESHPLHARSRIWLHAVAKGTLKGLLCRHALAEIWSVLTRLPVTPALSSQEALSIVERLLENGLTPIDLTHRSYDLALHRCADAGVRSGAIFDALHLVAAETAGAGLMLTFNIKDFRRVAKEVSPPILAPPDPPGLTIGPR